MTNVTTHARTLAASLLGLSLATPGSAQTSTADLIQRNTALLHSIDANDNESARCRAYNGKVVPPAPFDALAQRLKSGARPAEPVVVQVPVRREYVSYDGKGFVTVAGGAIATGKLHSDGMADVRAQVVLAAHENELPDWAKRVLVGLAPSERPLGSYAARNVLGMPIRVTEVERHTRGLALSGKQLFAVTDDDAIAMGFAAKLPATARTVRLALVVRPEAPFAIDESNKGQPPTAQQPVAYTERSTVVIAVPLCVLALAPTNRVLASADAGAN